MAKEVTCKDVLYALQYARQALVRWPGPKWTLEPVGTRVKPSVAEEARMYRGVVGSASARDGRQSYYWIAAA